MSLLLPFMHCAAVHQRYSTVIAREAFCKLATFLQSCKCIETAAYGRIALCKGSESLKYGHEVCHAARRTTLLQHFASCCAVKKRMRSGVDAGHYYGSKGKASTYPTYSWKAE